MLQLTVNHLSWKEEHKIGRCSQTKVNSQNWQPSVVKAGKLTQSHRQVKRRSRVRVEPLLSIWYRVYKTWAFALCRDRSYRSWYLSQDHNEMDKTREMNGPITFTRILLPIEANKSEWRASNVWVIHHFVLKDRVDSRNRQPNIAKACKLTQSHGRVGRRSQVEGRYHLYYLYDTWCTRHILLHFDVIILKVGSVQVLLDTCPRNLTMIRYEKLTAFEVDLSVACFSLATTPSTRKKGKLVLFSSSICQHDG